MPDSRRHRGPHPEDARLFARDTWPDLRQATSDLCWLLSRDYAPASALKLVGDRHQLAARQRAAVERCACADSSRDARQQRRVGPEQLADRPVLVDGYNVLTTVEAALGAAVILAARDGTYRDLASMHGTFRTVTETRPALELLGRVTGQYRANSWTWYLDRPVSNNRPL